MQTMLAAKSSVNATDPIRRTLSGTSIAIVVLAALLSSALILKFLPMPFVWLGWGWALGLLAGIWLLKASWARAVVFNAAVLTIICAATETYLVLHQHGRPTISGPYYVSDDVLGFAPLKGARAHVSKFERGKLVFDVTYTIDTKGLRIAPPAQTADLAGSVLFFGDSFTFGEGLQDDETMPYQVGIQSGGCYKVYNFGFHGYGPHQMLAAIESGRVRQVVDTAPRYAIYQVIPDHVARSAGKIPYGQHSPRYLFEADGTVHLNGHFDDNQKPPTVFETRLKGQLRKAAIYQILENVRPRADENDVRLLLAIVRKSRDLLVAEYPGIQFHVILWPNSHSEQVVDRELQEGFAHMNVRAHLVGNILPDYNTDSKKYVLSPFDGHPNALADRLIANYVVTKMLLENLEFQPLK